MSKHNKSARFSRPFVSRITGIPTATLSSYQQRGFPGGSEPWDDLSYVVAAQTAGWLSTRGLAKFELTKKIAFCIAEKKEAEWQEHFDRGQRLLIVDLCSGKVFLAEDSSTFATGGANTQFLVLDLEEHFSIVRRAVAAEARKLAEAN